VRLAFLTHRVPYAPNRGDRIRAYQMLRYFKAQGIHVCLVALAHDDEEVAHAAGLTSLVDALHVVRVTRARNLLKAVPALATERPLTHVLLDSGKMRPVLEQVRRQWQPDAVLAYCSGMARFAMEPPLVTLPFVLDMVDVDSFKWEGLAEASPGPRAWLYRREARVLRRFEANATRDARATLVVSTREAEALKSLDRAFAPVVLPNGVDVESFRNAEPPSTRPEVVFTGVFSYRPNEAGALWLIEQVWPLVRQRQPDAHLTLVGTGPGAMLERRAAQAGVEVTGTVPDVRPYLWRAAVAVAPLDAAHGVQNKVLEAVAAGLPAVVTPAVHEGLPDAVRPACLVASDAAGFAEAIAQLLALSAQQRRALASRACLDALTWETCLQPLAGILRRAAGVLA
jgi:sugar transferase (PEP-CTERM/EpsH1 system associated)